MESRLRWAGVKRRSGVRRASSSPMAASAGVGHAPCARHPLEQTQVSGRIHSVVKAFVRTHEANAAPASGQLRAQRRAKLRRTLEVHGTAAAFQQQFPGCVRQRRTAFHVSFPPRSVPKTLCRRRRPFCRPRRHLQKFSHRARLLGAHGAQRRVGENNERRHARALCEFQTQFLQALEQRHIRGQCRRALVGAGCLPGHAQRDGAAVFQKFQRGRPQ